MRSRTIVILWVGTFLAFTSISAAQQAPRVEQYLLAGKLADGEKALTAQLKTKPDDEQARFELGVLQFLRAVERLSQNFYRYGARTELGEGELPFFHAGNPAGKNPRPEKLNYESARAIIQQWVDDLAKAQATLAQVKDPNVKLPLHVGMIRLDLNGDGQVTDEETFWRLYNSINSVSGEIDVGCGGALQAPPKAPDDAADEKKAKEFVIAFDAADAHWLSGYCHLLMAGGEMILAHDWKDLFERTAPLFFANVETPHAWLNQRNAQDGDHNIVDILDGIAFIHLIHLPVKEPQRMQAALAHLQAVLKESRETWRLIMAETDNDHEWIPNPRQTGVIPDAKVTPEMVQSWLSSLDEADAILQGKKLVPFWRGTDELGLNIHRMFSEPKEFDLVLWIQGTAATPYLEKGPITTPETWKKMMDAFGEELPGYAIWFN